jgi:hypothetical protein
MDKQLELHEANLPNAPRRLKLLLRRNNRFCVMVSPNLCRSWTKITIVSQGKLYYNKSTLHFQLGLVSQHFVFKLSLSFSLMGRIFILFYSYVRIRFFIFNLIVRPSLLVKNKREVSGVLTKTRLN